MSPGSGRHGIQGCWGRTPSFQRAESIRPADALDERGRVRSALRRPIGSPRLSEIRPKRRPVVLIVDDDTRPTPAHRFLDLLLDELEGAGIAARDVLLIPALGIHTPMTRREMEAKVGAGNLSRISWENHDAFRRDANHLFGTTCRGTPVLLNRHLREAGLVILVGMVEPHLWAGFGGGLKNILPGVAHVETIAAHHGIIAEPPYLFNRVGTDPRANSFRGDLEEVAAMVDAPVFCLNVVLDHAGAVLAAFAGDPVACHRAAVDFNRSLSGRLLDHRVDGVITASHPMNINFKQSMKCIGNVLPALKPRGVVTGFLRAERGLDDVKVPEKGKPLWFTKRLLRLLGPSRVMGLQERVRPGLNVEEKFLVYYTMQLMREHDLFLCVPTLDAEAANRLGFFRHATDPQEIIARARAGFRNTPRWPSFPRAAPPFPSWAVRKVFVARTRGLSRRAAPAVTRSRWQRPCGGLTLGVNTFQRGRAREMYVRGVS